LCFMAFLLSKNNDPHSKQAAGPHGPEWRLQPLGVCRAKRD
jgi:hypothetical protein